MPRRGRLLAALGAGLALAACGEQATTRVAIVTPLGEIELALATDAAPLTAANFLRYVDAGRYSGATFYRVVHAGNQAQNTVLIDVIQGGLGAGSDPAAFAPIAHESTEATGLRHTDGVISMARGEPGTAGSEFFICLGDQPELDFGGRRNPDGLGFAAFGRVVAGMDVVRAIQALPTVPPPASGALDYTSGQMLQAPVPIVAVERVR